MQKEIQEYKLAMEESIEASKFEGDAKARKKKAHYRLLRAKDELRAKESEILQDLDRN